MQQPVASHLAKISSYADIRFNFVGYFDSPVEAHAAGSEINIAPSGLLEMFSGVGALARGFFPKSDADAQFYVGEAGDIFLNSKNNSIDELTFGTPGTSGWWLYMHELGHTLGLKHPHDTGGTGRPTLGGLYGYDIDLLSVMTYPSNAYFESGGPSTPLLLDVLALQYLYGPNMATNAEDSMLQLYSTGDYRTHWDAGGFDCVTALGSGEGWYISLPEVPCFSLVDTKVGLAMPIADTWLEFPQTMIWLAGDYEVAQGSEFDDDIFANDFDNLIEGCGGNDHLEGMDGIDSALYASSSTAYQIQYDELAQGYLVMGPAEVDALRTIERVIFADKRVAIDLQGNAGVAVKLLGALAGPSAAHDAHYIGFVLALLDDDITPSFVAQAALDILLGPARTSVDVVDLMYQMIAGIAAPQGDRDYYKSLLDTQVVSEADFVIAASQLELNLDHIGYAGMVNDGVEYLL